MSRYIDADKLMGLVETESRKWGDEYDAYQILSDIEDFPRLELSDILKDAHICGYNFKDLITFADACNRQGITNDDLSDYVHNIKAAYGYAMEKIMDEFEKSERRMKMVNRVTVESVMRDGESE